MHHTIQATIILLLVATAAEAATQLHGSVNLGLGRQLSPEDPAAVFSTEPEILLNVDSRWQGRLSTLVERPTDAYTNLRVPKTIGAVDFFVGVFKFSASGNALELDRWGTDGAMFRGTLSAEATAKLS